MLSTPGSRGVGGNNGWGEGGEKLHTLLPLPLILVATLVSHLIRQVEAVHLVPIARDTAFTQMNRCLGEALRSCKLSQERYVGTYVGSSQGIECSNRFTINDPMS